jgi:hypothetical protein
VNDDTHYAKGPQQSSAGHGYAATPLPATPFRWVEQVPTEPGFYWARFRSSLDHREGSHVVEVYRDDRGGLNVRYQGEPLMPGEGVLKDARWAGPIDEPAG